MRASRDAIAATVARVGTAAAVLSLLLAIAAYCVIPPKIVSHSFSFGDVNGKQNQGVRILDYRYGEDKTAPTRPEAWQLESGRIPQFIAMSTFAPPGAYLYVKWRVLSTGKVYEDTVDLRSRLPGDMNHKELHFTIHDAQLFVHLISSEEHEVGKPYKRTCMTLYPQRTPQCNYNF